VDEDRTYSPDSSVPGLFAHERQSDVGEHGRKDDHLARHTDPDRCSYIQADELANTVASTPPTMATIRAIIIRPSTVVDDTEVPTMRLVTYLSVDDRRPLASITKLCRESFRIEKALTELVLAARKQGHTWTEIGGALGTTKQAAWRRFVRGPLGERFDENEAT
jgi:hypothetical protein